MEAFEYQLSNEPIFIDTLAAYPGTLQEEYSFHNTTFTAELTPRPDADIRLISRPDTDDQIYVSECDYPKQTTCFRFRVHTTPGTRFVLFIENNFPMKIWLNQTIISMSDDMYLSVPIVHTFEQACNEFVLEAPILPENAYMTMRLSRYEDEIKPGKLSLLHSNRYFRDKTLWIIDNQRDFTQGGIYRFITVLNNTVDLDPDQDVWLEIGPSYPFQPVETRFIQIGVIYEIDPSLYDFAPAAGLTHLVFRFHYRYRDGRQEDMTTDVFLHDIFQSRDRLLRQAKEMLSLIQPEEMDLLAWEQLQNDFEICRDNPMGTLYTCDRLAMLMLAWQDNGHYWDLITSGKQERVYYRSALDHRVNYYDVTLPRDYDGQQSYPLIIANSMANRGFHSICFQSYSGRQFILADFYARGVTMGSYIGEAAIMEQLSHLMNLFPIDPQRIYAYGTSNGASATWAIAQRYPDLFAGIYVFSGLAEHNLMQNLAHVKVVNYSSDFDTMKQPTFDALEPRLKKLPDYEGCLPAYYKHVWLHQFSGKVTFIEEMLSKSAEKYPQDIDFLTYDACHLKAFWVELDGISYTRTYAKVKLHADSGMIRIRARNITGLRLKIPPFINRSFFTVHINGHVFYYEDFDATEIHYVKQEKTFIRSQQTAYNHTERKGVRPS